MDEQKAKKLGEYVIGLYLLGIEIENFEEEDAFLGKSHCYFSVPKKYSDDFIMDIEKVDSDDANKLKTKDGIIENAKESIIKVITYCYTELCEDDDKEFLDFLTNYFKFYAKVRDEEWSIEKGREKVKQINQEIEKLMQVKNEWKEV